MKIPYLKSISLIIVILSISVMCWSQKSHSPRSNDKIESMRIAYITDQLNLSSEEAREFWPVYNQFNDSMEKLRTEERNLVENNESIDEVEAKKIMTRLINISEEQLNLEKTYILNLSKIIGYQKSLQLKSFERSFKRELFYKMKRK